MNISDLPVSSETNTQSITEPIQEIPVNFSSDTEVKEKSIEVEKTSTTINTELIDSVQTPKDFSKPKSSIISNINKIAFQFTYFCQFFCPIMNEQFKRTGTSVRKNFSVPEGCYNHLQKGHKHINDFNDLYANESVEQIFTSPSTKEDFFDFIRELDLPVIDKICHFSSILILSSSKHTINDEYVLDFIKDLEDDFFSA